MYDLEKRRVIYCKQTREGKRTSVPTVKGDPKDESNPTRTCDGAILDEIPPQKRKHRKLVLPYTRRHETAESHNQHHNNTSLSPFLTLIPRKSNCKQYKCKAGGDENHSDDVEFNK